MASIREMKKRIAELNTDKVIEDAMTDSSDGLANLNVEQLNKGQRADGREMPDYSPASVEIFGKPEGPIKLYDTGAFYRGMFARVENGKVIYSSTDDKTEMLVKGDGHGGGGYGKQIFGLNENFKSEGIREYVQPSFKKKMEDATKLKMV
jgi:hypothetical protein